MNSWQTPAQSLVQPDSVLLVANPGTDEVGFVLPRLAAAHYRYLYDLSKELEAQNELFKQQLNSLRSLAENRSSQITEQQDLIANLNAQNSTLEGDLEKALAQREVINNARLSERRRKNFWRTTTIILAGVAGGALLLQ